MARRILDQKTIERLKSIETPIHGKVEAIYKGTCALELVGRKIFNVISTQFNRNPYEDAIAGTYYRMCAWMASLVKLNAPLHIQAAYNGARGLFELLTDLKELKATPALAARFDAFTFVERFTAATIIVQNLAAHGVVDPKKGSVERAFISNPKNIAEYDNLRRTHWGVKADGSPVTPKDHWSNKNMAERTRALGSKDELTYRLLYKMLSWYVHAGPTGLAGLSANGVEGAFGMAHNHAQSFFYDASVIACEVFPIFTAQPPIRDELNSFRDVIAKSMIDVQLAALDSLESEE